MLVREVCVAYGVMVVVIEDNGFQRWLVQELRKYPETAGRVLPHTTGAGRADLREGVPALRLVLDNGLWTVPNGDVASRSLARTWQDELGAFGYRNNVLAGIGDHDDLVMATWFVERGINFIEATFNQLPQYEFGTGRDLGIERYRISPDLDADGDLGPEDIDELRRAYRRWPEDRS